MDIAVLNPSHSFSDVEANNFIDMQYYGRRREVVAQETARVPGGPSSARWLWPAALCKSILPSFKSFENMLKSFAEANQKDEPHQTVVEEDTEYSRNLGREVIFQPHAPLNRSRSRATTRKITLTGLKKSANRGGTAS
ncbi:hypothetical protein Nepgr_021915 [Nepenthes gracilis]|uniref:Uncharacterized protein n=1 Tax=Nepenthes gracilis TaxID=150966 RepID=A0AAD3SZZ5_NEPGR|nr:hypothetical protein Nepgr_021915 [Nepenthes gracilis]